MYKLFPVVVFHKKKILRFRLITLIVKIGDPSNQILFVVMTRFPFGIVGVTLQIRFDLW